MSHSQWQTLGAFDEASTGCSLVKLQQDKPLIEDGKSVGAKMSKGFLDEFSGGGVVPLQQKGFEDPKNLTNGTHFISPAAGKDWDEDKADEEVDELLDDFAKELDSVSTSTDWNNFEEGDEMGLSEGKDSRQVQQEFEVERDWVECDSRYSRCHQSDVCFKASSNTISGAGGVRRQQCCGHGSHHRAGDQSCQVNNIDSVAKSLTKIGGGGGSGATGGHKRQRAFGDDTSDRTTSVGTEKSELRTNAGLLAKVSGGCSEKFKRTARVKEWANFKTGSKEGVETKSWNAGERLDDIAAQWGGERVGSHALPEHVVRSSWGMQCTLGLAAGLEAGLGEGGGGGLPLNDLPDVSLN
ncbi:unnamed protein product [Choristocarpus tenellus]